MTEHQETDQMSFMDHLEALRWHIIRSMAAIMIFALVAFMAKSFVFEVIILGPYRPDFPTFRALCMFSEWLNASWPTIVADPQVLCIGQNLPALTSIVFMGQFINHIFVSLVIGFVAAFPYVFWEFWRFLKPGLKAAEQQMSTGVIFFTSVLFSLGVVFGYFIIAPLSINFFGTYQVADTVVNNPTLDSYITIITSVMLGCGVVFELPMVVYFLSRLGLVSPELLRKYRKHALVGSLILAAVITPPDVFSQVLVCIPLMILYEVSIWVSKITVSRSER